MALQAHFKVHPKDRIKLSTAHPDKSRENCFFLGYHRDYANGERWGTKEQLVKRRQSVTAAQKALRKRKMKHDPAYRETRLAALAAFEKRRGICKEVIQEAADEELAAKRKRLAKHYKRKARAKKAKLAGSRRQ